MKAQRRLHHNRVVVAFLRGGTNAEAIMTSQRDFFDSRARDWEATCYPPDVRKRLEALAPLFGVKRGSRILDVGTGPGVLIPYLRRTGGASARIWAFDLSWLMVREATAHRSAGRDLVLQADVHHIPCRAASFDHIICFAAFPHFDDPKRALTELARVARPGADIIIAHLLSREELAHHHGSHKAVADDILPDPARMTALFIEAGFTAPHITDVPGRYLAVGKRW